uniref:Uncharacterized protein n=1 Tax=Anguilla anguilla TaxID=7936 RepID=A0A0E9W6R4_ANGAN
MTSENQPHMLIKLHKWPTNSQKSSGISGLIL